VAADAMMPNPDSGTAAHEPVVLATVPFPGVSSFAIDGTSLYWTTFYTGTDGSLSPQNGTVSKCPLAGCADAPTLLATRQSFPEKLLVRGSTLYWLDNNAGSAMRCSVDCNDDAVVLQQWPAISSVGDFTVNSTTLFFSFFGPNNDDLVQECSTTGCANPVTFASGQTTPTDMATNAMNLIWIDLGVATGGKATMFLDGGVMTCPLQGCDGGVTTLAAGLNYPNSLAADDATAYWAQAGSVLACAVSGCNGAPTMIASLPTGYDGVGGVAVDATDVYFGARSSVAGPSWSIWKCARTGCSGGPTMLASTSFVTGNPLEQVAVDSSRVYFVSGDGTQILAVDK
jgi:hypothetical protein